MAPIPFPRATSEPPPDIDESHHLKPIGSKRFGTQGRHKVNITSSAHPSSLKLAMPEAEEYSWEWGNFPQKTPVWTAFNHAQSSGGDQDLKGKGRMSPDDEDIVASDYWSHDPSPGTFPRDFPW